MSAAESFMLARARQIQSLVHALWGLSLLLVNITHAHAGDYVEYKSGPNRVALVELYTSEGCHSCPPADRWLSAWVDDARLWKQLVPVAFHVDYWDYLGWTDRFGSGSYSMRQREYAQQGALRNVYTPGFVVNGREWRGWFRDPRLDFRRVSATDAGELTLRLTGQRIEARYLASARLERLMLNIALLGAGIKSEIARGENAGKTLNHDFVVLGFRNVDLTEQTGTQAGTRGWQAATSLPSSSVSSARFAVAAWVTQTPLGPPLQAVGGWLAAD